jgi:lipoprotein-anchoring transpeptidase ErfK/SrfK
MRPVLVGVFVAGALCAPAFADPIAVSPEAYAAAMAQQGADIVSQQRYAQAADPNGRGFIQYLFGNTTSRPSPQVYQPAPQQVAPSQQADAPQQIYAPQQVSAPQQDYAPQQAYPPQQSYGAQQDYAPQQAYAPSSQGNMAQPQVDPKYDRQLVAYDGKEGPGTIIIDTPNKYLYLVEQHGKALRYGIGVGRPGFTWAGVKTITAMREWPEWRPPSDMLARRPDLPRYMAGGPENPLGARAMYLGSTLYRIHGSNEPWTIGTNVSSGCIRMRNADVIDLYGRVTVGTKVVVI